MMSIRSGKMCLLATVCLFVFCSNVAAHGAVHARSSSGAHHQSRSFASAPAKRMHRLRRRFPPMPKPAGTFGAATSDAENLQLLKAFSDELSVINSAWQKSANEQLASGQTVEDFAAYAHRIGSDVPIGVTDTSLASSLDVNSDDRHKEKSSLKHEHPQKHNETTPAPQTPPPSKQKTSKPKDEPQPVEQPQPEPQPQEKPQKKPQPKQEPQVKPQPQPQPKPEQPKPKPAPKQSAPSGGSGLTAKYAGQMFAGSMTYYDVGLDACGQTDVKSDYIVAVAQEWFDEFSGGDNNPNRNPICGIKINIEKNGKKTQATIKDICPSCDRGHLDMSEDLFTFFIPTAVGLSDVKWGFA